MFPPTRQEFLDEYTKLLIKNYPWAQKPERLAGFIALAVRRLDENSSKQSKTDNKWNYSGKLVAQAWKILGGKDRPTMTALRQMDKSGAVACL